MKTSARGLTALPLLALVLFLGLAVATDLRAQEAFSTIEERMTGKEFTAAGLDKLSPEELAALNNWLRAHSVATLETARSGVGTVAPVTGGAAAAATSSGDMRGFEDQLTRDLPDDDIVAGVVGPFKGWSGNTVFRLDNGMVWKQAEPGTFYLPEKDNATVVIRQAAFKSWRLKVEGYGKSVRVERIE